MEKNINQTKEIYKVIPEFPNYEVSNLGNVRNVKTGRQLKCCTVTRPSPHRRCALRNNGSSYVATVGSLVAKIHVPNPNGYKRYIYKDFNNLNVTADNILWVSGDVYTACKFRKRRGKSEFKFDTRENQINKLERNIESANLFLSYLKENDIAKVNGIVLLFDEELKKCIRRYTKLSDVQNECYQHTVMAFMDSCERNVVTTTNLKGYLCAIARTYFLKKKEEKAKAGGSEYSDAKLYKVAN